MKSRYQRKLPALDRKDREGLRSLLREIEARRLTATQITTTQTGMEPEKGDPQNDRH